MNATTDRPVEKASTARRFAGGVLDALFPRVCVLCRSADCADVHLCSKCARAFDLASAEPFCPRCAHGVGPYGVQDGRCHACRDKRPWIDAMVRVGAYRGSIGLLVRKLKYCGRDEIDLFVAARLAESMRLSAWFERIDALVYVPTHWTHSLGRRYYAPRVLTNALSRETGLPIAQVLRRASGGPHQLNVTRSRRRDNVRGKFGVIAGTVIDGARLCLIDDVSTVGATINECARTLKRAGAAVVYGAVIAKVNTESGFTASVH